MRAFLVAGWLFLGAATVAASVSLPQQRVNPGSIYYPLKRVWEKVRERTLVTEKQKTAFYQSLMAIRLAELDYVTSRRLLGETQTASQRFAYYAGRLVQARPNSLQTVKLFASYVPLLEKMRDLYPANSAQWLLVQQDIDTLQLLSDRLK